MRITSIGANYNTLRPQNQNIGFGQFQDKKVKKAYKGIAIDPEFNDVEEIYKRDVAGCKYIEKSPYVTVKGAKDKKGKYFIYAVANKDAIKKHKNKKFYDNVREMYPKSCIDYYPPNKIAVKSGIVKKEPEFLTVIADYSDAYDLYDIFIKQDKNYNKPPEPPEPQYSDEEDNFTKNLRLEGHIW